MKPTPQTQNQRSPREDSRREPRNFPLTDYSYQATVEAVDRSSTVAAKGMAEMRTFRKVSSEFFSTEATPDFVTEAIFFAWISCVAAWPMAVLIHQLLRWTI